jgi:hypothetical protein
MSDLEKLDQFVRAGATAQRAVDRALDDAQRAAAAALGRGVVRTDGDGNVLVGLVLTPEAAAHLALYLARLHFDDFLGKTCAGQHKEDRTEQAYRFRNAVVEVEKALEKAHVSKAVRYAPLPRSEEPK